MNCKIFNESNLFLPHFIVLFYLSSFSLNSSANRKIIYTYMHTHSHPHISIWVCVYVCVCVCKCVCMYAYIDANKIFNIVSFIKKFLLMLLFLNVFYFINISAHSSLYYSKRTMSLNSWICNHFIRFLLFISTIK